VQVIQWVNNLWKNFYYLRRAEIEEGKVVSFDFKRAGELPVSFKEVAEELGL